MNRTFIGLGTALVLVAIILAGCGSSTDKVAAPANLTFSGGALPVAVPQQPYSQTVAVSGGQKNYEFDLDHDLLPPGIIAEWVDNDLVFHGTPTQLGTYTIPVTVIDANKDTADAIFIITVANPSGVAGNWSMVITVTSATGVCAGEEGVSPAVPITIVQSGSAVTVSGFLGNTAISLSGTLSGPNDSVITISGSFPEDGGTTTATHVWTLTSPTTMVGTEAWSWTDGAGSCPGSTSSVVCTRVGI